MTTPQPQQDRPANPSSAPTSPIAPVSVNINLSTENSAFYSEPSFEDPKNKGDAVTSPAQDTATAMLDIKNPPKEKALPQVQTAQTLSQTAQDPAASTATATAVADVPMTPVSAASNPTSPLAASAPHTIALNTTMTISGTAESDTEMVEDKDQTSEVVPPLASSMEDAAPKENGVGFAGQDEGKMQSNKVEELQTLNSSLQVSLEEVSQEKQMVDQELNRTRGAFHDLHRQHLELQQKLAKRDRDYEVMSKNYLEHVRLIRATDDDHYTVMDRLTQLKASIEHLIRKAQGGRSVNLNKEAAVEHFKNSGLLDAFPVPEDKLESYHLNLYMESVVMSTLVSCFFEKSLSCIFDFNKGFKEIYDWMCERNEKPAIRWRQQLCVMLIQDPVTKARQEEEVATAANALSELVSKVYANTNELAKIRDICNKAFELAIAMTGLESVIKPVTIPMGTPFDEENMATSLKSNPEGKVALVIFPAFRDKECAFDVRPKVWCY